MPPEIWILAVGSFISNLGSGFTALFTPIVFVNQVELSPPEVGLGLAMGAFVAVLGSTFSGWYSDRVGRRWILIASAVIACIGCGVLSLSRNFIGFIIGNLILKLGGGIYHPAEKATVADLCPSSQRQKAFALIESPRLIGLSLGVLLGGSLLGESFRWLFIVDGLSFGIFALILIVKLPESRQKTIQFQNNTSLKSVFDNFSQNKVLQFYLVLQVAFTFFITQSKSILPLYLKLYAEATRLTKLDITVYCTLIVLTAGLIQFPLIRLVRPMGLVGTFRLSAGFWSLGFGWIFLVGLTNAPIWPGILILAIAIASFSPTNSSFLTQLAPLNLLGTYVTIGSISWSLGPIMGSPVGGWFLDLPRPGPDILWLLLMGLALAVAGGLQRLGRIAQKSHLYDV